MTTVSRGPDTRKKKHKRQHDEMLVTTRGQKGRLSLTKEAINHFEKMLEAPCPNHHYPIWHAYKSYVLHWKFLTKEASSRRGPEPQRANRWEEKSFVFPDETRCLLIFGGPDYYASKRH